MLSKLGYDKEEFIQLIKDKSTKIKRIPEPSDFKGINILRICKNYFNSWEDAIKVALDTDIELLKKNTDKRIRRKKAKESKEDANSIFCNPIESNENYNVELSKEKLIKILRGISKRLGRIPTVDDIKHSSPAFIKAFGSFENAILESGLLDDKFKDYTKEQIVELLVNWRYKNYNLDIATISGDNNMPSPRFIMYKLDVPHWKYVKDIIYNDMICFTYNGVYLYNILFSKKFLQETYSNDIQVLLINKRKYNMSEFNRMCRDITLRYGFNFIEIIKHLEIEYGFKIFESINITVE